MNHTTSFAHVPPLDLFLFLLLGGALIAAYLWTNPRQVEDGAE
jgi:hypothetical protein